MDRADNEVYVYDMDHTELYKDLEGNLDNNEENEK